VAREPVNLTLVRQSLETSLRELQTDYVDLYFIHEGELADCQTPGLHELLQDFVREGKVRAFGVGSSFERIQAINAQMPQFAQVFQFESSALEPHIAVIQQTRQAQAQPPALLSTHGAVAALAPLRTHLQDNSDFAQRFTEAFGANATQPAQLAALLLRYARHENPDGIILFRSTKRENLRANMEALTGNSPYTEAMFAQLTGLLSPNGTL
jgi:aryl-alcohol dehydrogenase-like predicted oxidoreductase